MRSDITAHVALGIYHACRFLDLVLGMMLPGQGGMRTCNEGDS